MAPIPGKWVYQKNETQHHYQWRTAERKYCTDKARTFATITSPAALHGTIAVSGWSNSDIFEHDVLDNSSMTSEAEQLARDIKCYIAPQGWRPCHAETQLITFYVNYLEKFPEALKYLESRKRSKMISSAKRLDISVSRPVCEFCHQFATLVYLCKRIEVKFFVDNKPDYPRCQVCRTTIPGYRALECRTCEAKVLQISQDRLGFKSLTTGDLDMLRQALRWYVAEKRPGSYADDRVHDELPYIEISTASALKCYSDWHNVIAEYLKQHHHTFYKYLLRIDWKFDEYGKPDCDENDTESRIQAVTVTEVSPKIEAGKVDSGRNVDEDEAIVSLTRQTAALDCNFKSRKSVKVTVIHDETSWFSADGNAGPDTDK